MQSKKKSGLLFYQSDEIRKLILVFPLSVRTQTCWECHLGGFCQSGVEKKKCPRRDSNAQPSAPQAGALSIKLRGRYYKTCDSNPISLLGQAQKQPDFQVVCRITIHLGQ